MAMKIDNSQQSQLLHRRLAEEQKDRTKTMEKLVTGLRIGDALSQGIGDRLGGDIRALHQSVRNANDGISMAKVGEGALNEISGMLERVKELEVQKGNGALSSGDLASIDEEISSIMDEVSNIQANTEFNGQSLLNGASASFTVGEDSSESYSLDVAAATTSGVSIDEAIENVSRARSEFGQAANVLSSRAENSATRAENLTAARSQVMDADIASEMANMTRSMIMQRAGVALQAQANQNASTVSALLDT